MNKKNPCKIRAARAIKTMHGGVEIWLSSRLQNATELEANLSVPYVDEADNHIFLSLIHYMLLDAEAPLLRIEVHPEVVCGFYKDSYQLMGMVTTIPPPDVFPPEEMY